MEAVTDENGVAVFTVEAGTYVWDASKAGFKSKTGTVTVNADKTINIILEPLSEVTSPLISIASSLIVGGVSLAITQSPTIAILGGVAGGVVGGFLIPKFYVVNFLDSLTPHARLWLEKNRKGNK